MDDIERLVEDLLVGDDLAEQDKTDLRPLLLMTLRHPKIDNQCAPIVRKIPPIDNWRAFLNEGNIIDFFSNPTLHKMMKMADEIVPRGEFLKVDFQEDFYLFVLKEFCKIYAPGG